MNNSITPYFVIVLKVFAFLLSIGFIITYSYIALGTLVPFLLFGACYTYWKWRREKSSYNEVGLVINNFFAWISMYYKGAREGIRLKDRGIGLEFQVSLQYWYLPSSPACSNFIFALNKIDRLPFLTDPIITSIFKFFIDSFDKNHNCFRLNPAKPNPVNVSKSHIDSSVVMVLSILFSDRDKMKNSEDTLLNNPLHLGKKEKMELSNKFPELASDIDNVERDLIQRREILINKLENNDQPLVEISEIASTIYLIDALKTRKLLDDRLKSAVSKYLLKKCARRLKNGSEEIKGIAQENEGDIIGFSMNSRDGWACLCATHLVLSIVRDMGIINKDENNIFTIKNLKEMICRIIPRRFEEKRGAFMPRKGDPVSIIPLRYAIKLIRWEKKQKESELQLPEEFWEKIVEFINKCRNRKEKYVFSYFPKGNPNILATRYIIDINSMIKDLNNCEVFKYKIPIIFSDEETEDIKNSIKRVFYQSSSSAFKGAK